MTESDGAISELIARWRDVRGRERANDQLFLTELTAALGLLGRELSAADPRRARPGGARRLRLERPGAADGGGERQRSGNARREGDRYHAVSEAE